MKTRSTINIVIVLAMFCAGQMVWINTQSTPTVYAQDQTTPTPQTSLTPSSVEKMEKAYVFLNKGIEKQNQKITKAEEVLKKSQEKVEEMKSTGEDTKTIDISLAAFKNSIDSAKLLYDQAKSVLDTHAGLNDEGKVTDDKDAETTLKNAREAFVGTRTMLVDSLKTFRTITRMYRVKLNDPA